jgi:hypothetical protein
MPACALVGQRADLSISLSSLRIARLVNQEGARLSSSIQTNAEIDENLAVDAYVRDPLPAPCEAVRRNAVDNGRVLFIDADYLSGYGNDRLFPLAAVACRN